MIAFSDSHCHLQMGGDAPALLTRAREAGVSRFLVPGTTLEDSAAAVELAAAHPDVRAAVGIHPHEAKDFDPKRDGAALEELARTPRVVAIGEVGLDFHYDRSPLPWHVAVLEWMLYLECRLSLPAILQMREWCIFKISLSER
ncbi:MAG: TatD family hydrolase, partial [Thermoanaerobaculia bacterium]